MAWVACDSNNFRPDTALLLGALNMRLEHVPQLATSRADWLWPNDVFGQKQNVNNKYQNLMVTRKVNLQPST